jgi:hypothetical protein
MILETIVTTHSRSGAPHIAPMGLQVVGPEYLIMPFRPSTTLENVLDTGCAVINFTDDVRIFAGCLTGRRDWPLQPADRVECPRLSETLAHTELRLVRIDDDALRPKLWCCPVHEASHRPFRGFNRAQFSVVEAAVLVSRLALLPSDKIERELEYLRIAVEKTAGPRELQAWDWLMDAVERHKLQGAAEVLSP